MSISPSARQEAGPYQRQAGKRSARELSDENPALVDHIVAMIVPENPLGLHCRLNLIISNYDGENKHKTIIEDDVFIGSDTMLIAPLKIGKSARTGAGSVVNKDVPADTVVVGIPARAIKKSRKKE